MKETARKFLRSGLKNELFPCLFLEFGVAALSAGKAVFVVGKEYTWSASGTELFESGYGVALDFVVIFYCHVYTPQ
jgi:hypothetical protein